MTKKLQVGLIGCGRWGQHILRDLLSLGCDVLVVTPSDRGQKNSREAGSLQIVEKIADLPPVSGLIVATPTNTHAAVNESLLERDVPIFTEKLLTADRESALRLARQAPEHLRVGCCAGLVINTMAGWPCGAFDIRRLSSHDSRQRRYACFIAALTMGTHATILFA